MPTPVSNPIVITGLSFSWPDGGQVFNGLNAVFGSGRTGLIGPNGIGKTALLRLITAQLRPAEGTITTAGEVAYLPQLLPLATTETVADLLGIAAKRRALTEVLRGNADAHNFEILDNDWDIEERALGLMASYGFSTPGVPLLDRAVGSLSGGEAMSAALAGVRLSSAPITLLDEPTNNLDRRARMRFYDAVASWRGTLLVVSHDRELLELMDDIAQLHPVQVRSLVADHVQLRRYGGNFSTFLEQNGAERQAAERAVRDARSQLRSEKQQRIEAETKIARRARQGRAAAESMPKALADGFANRAEISAGKHRGMMQAKVEDAALRLDRAEDQLDEDRAIRIDLPATAVPAGRMVVELRMCGSEESLSLRGPERTALCGDNGSGKTTLLNAVARWRSDGNQHSGGTPAQGRPGVVVHSRVPNFGYLRQRLDGLDDGATVLENVRRSVPAASPGDIRAQLARFSFRKDRPDRLAAELSGGERFRVALARILLADPAPQLLLLDEPTNNLDLESVDQLVQALGAYRGALLVVSHDHRFLEAIGLDSAWRLTRTEQEFELRRE